MDTHPKPGTALDVVPPNTAAVSTAAVVATDQGAVMAEFDAILDRERRRAALHQAIMPENRAALISALQAAGIIRLEVNYDGYGDSGQINEQNATLADGSVVALEDVPAAALVTLANVDFNLDIHRNAETLAAAVETYCYDVLETFHSGYENNDGGNGDFTFDVEAGTIELVHNDVVTDYDTTTHEL